MPNSLKKKKTSQTLEAETPQPQYFLFQPKLNKDKWTHETTNTSCRRKVAKNLEEIRANASRTFQRCGLYMRPPVFKNLDTGFFTFDAH